jgi:myo-inositol-1(or 4)-monophosphatase
LPESDLELLIRAARAAGEIALAHRALGAHDVIEKPGDAGPVTQADLAINRMLEDVLRKARPDYGWLSEESIDDPARLDAGRCFIIDPIDGTRAFIAGESGFAHSLAVARDGVVTDAVVHLPAAGLTYSARAGAAAHLNDRVIRVREGGGDDPPRTLLAARPALEARHWPGGVPLITRSFRASLAWRLCLVAEGRFDAMITLRDTWEWDIAAGALIAGRAGAVVTDASGGALRFNARRPMTPGILAAGDAVYSMLLAGRRGHPGAPQAIPR